MITDPVVKALAHAEIDLGATITMIEAAGNGDTCHGLRQTMNLIKSARSVYPDIAHLRNLLREARQYIADAGSDENAETQKNSAELLTEIDDVLASR